VGAVAGREPLRHLTTVVGTVQGHLVVGRLRTEGIDAVMTGPGDGPYPFPSDVEILVPESQLAAANEVLLANAVEAVFDDADDAPPRRRSGIGRWRLRRRAGPSARDR
jgi:hypothetical protein